MKVAIIGFNELEVMPYAKVYRSILDENKIDYDLISWNRTKNDMTSVKERNYEINIKVKGGKLVKLLKFIVWKHKIIKIFKKNKYDKIVVLTTLPAVILSKYLIKNYKNNYIFDLRDYTYEKIKIYKKIENRIINCSYNTFLSSKGFMEFIEPNEKIKMIHNLPASFKQKEKSCIDVKCIDILYLGIVSYAEENKRLVRDLGGVENVRLIYQGLYHGAIKLELEKICKENKYSNVIFKGRYDNSKKEECYKNISLINAIYGNKQTLTTTLTPNKLYDCILYKIPIMVSEGTYLAELVKKYKLGIVLKEADDTQKIIAEYFSHFNIIEFNSNCEKIFMIIQKEQNEALNIIKKYFMDKRNEY